jgi:hypothetical protein
MRGFINKIFKLLNLGGRDWVVFLLALLLAFSTWIIHNLSLKYSVYLKVEVVAKSNIEGRSEQAISGTEVMAKCRTSGWNILYSRMIRDNVVAVDFPSSVFQYEGDDNYCITSDRLHEYVEQIFGQNVSVEYFVTDKVSFSFQEEVSKRVPVKPVSSISFEDQFMANGSLVLVPDSVTVYGDKMHLDQLEYVTTATIKHSSVREGFSGMVSLTPISGMRLSVDDVHYKMDVARYLEVQRKAVPVSIEGAPAGVNVALEPRTVDVRLYVEFPLRADPNKDLNLVVKYDDILNSISGLVTVEPLSLPMGVIKYDITPVAVKIMEVQK